MDCYMFFRHIIVDSQPLCSSADLLRFNMEGKSNLKLKSRFDSEQGGVC